MNYTRADIEDDSYGVDEVLQHAFLITPDVLQLKDGGFLAAWQYTGIDYDARHPSLERATRDFLGGLLNHGKGWMLETNVIRQPTSEYPTWGEFPDPVSQLIEDERKHYFQESGVYYRTRYFCSLAFFPPSTSEEKARNWLYHDTTGEADQGLAEKALLEFEGTVARWQRLCSSVLEMRRLGQETFTEPDTGAHHECNELLRYVRFMAMDEDRPFLAPPADTRLDVLIPTKRLRPGAKPILGTEHLRPIALDSYPGRLEAGAVRRLEALPIPFRFHSRAIFLDRREAAGMHTYDKARHNSGIRAFWARVKSRDAKPGEQLNGAAQQLRDQSELALSLGPKEQWALYSGHIVLLRDDPTALLRDIGTIEEALLQCGIGIRVETDNAVEAWMGTLPGHAWFNVRRGLMRTFNVASLATWHTTWRGFPESPSPKLPKHSPPLVIGSTPGREVFCGNTFVQDVGHTACIGQTGNGKTTVEALHAVSYLRYPGTRVYLFDRLRTKYVLTKALGGAFWDYGRGNSPRHCPLQFLSTEADRAWAANYIETLCKMNTLDPTAAQREEIGRAVDRIARRPQRSLSHFLAAIHDGALREALHFYTVANPISGGVLDGEFDPVEDTNWNCFEMYELKQMHPALATATMLHQWRRIERTASTDHITAIFVDEAAALVQDPFFGPALGQALTELRNRGGFVWLSFQMMEQFLGTELAPVISQQCKNRYFLPNSAALDEKTAASYRAMGLSDIRIARIAHGTPRRDYFYHSAEQDPLKGKKSQHPESSLGGHFAQIQYQVDPVALLFLAANSDEQRNRVDTLIAQHGPENWQSFWIAENGFPQWAEYYDRLVTQRKEELVA